MKKDMKQLVVLIPEKIHYQIKMAALKKNIKLKDWVVIAFLDYLGQKGKRDGEG